MKYRIVFLLLFLPCFAVFAQNTGQAVAIYPQTVVYVKNKSAFFSPDGKYFVTGAFNDQVHVWDFENSCLLKTLGYEIEGYPKTYKYFDESVFPVFSPDGTKIAALFRSYPDSLKEEQTEKLVIYDTDTDEIAYNDAGWGGNHKMFMVFSNNSRMLAYFEKIDKDIRCLSVLSVNRRNSDRIIKNIIFTKTKPAVLSMAFSEDDRILALGTEKGITLIDLTEDSNVELPSAPVYSIKYTKDGKRIAAADGGNIKIWNTENNRLVRTLLGRRNANVMSLALSSDDKYIVASFSDKTIMKWDITKENALLNIGNIPVISSSVDIHPNDKYILAGCEDGTISCLDFISGQEIVKYMSFNVEWLSITPDGYYNASPHGDEYINIRIGNDVYGVNQFSRAYYQPDVVSARMKGLSDPAVVKHFGNIFLTAAPPAVMVELQNKNAAVSSGIAELKIKAVDAFKKYPLEHIEIIINGRLVGGAELSNAGGGQVTPLQTKLAAKSSPSYIVDFNLSVKLDEGPNHIEIVAANEACYGLKVLDLTTTIKNQNKPDLWLLSIGINDYINLPAEREETDNGLVKLTGAVKDAKRIISTFTDQQGKRYKTVHTRIITDGEKITPTRENILANMDFLKQAKPEDLIVLFIAAHGVTTDNVFYVLPSDIPIDAAGIHPDLNKAIDINALLNALDTPGRKMILIDTCQSGGVDNNMLIRSLKNRSIVIFTASRQNELSQESEEYGGHFTYSFVEGLKGKAAKGQAIALDDLGAYVSDLVGSLSRFGGRGIIRQHPSIIIPDGFKNFILAEIK